MILKNFPHFPAEFLPARTEKAFYSLPQNHFAARTNRSSAHTNHFVAHTNGSLAQTSHFAVHTSGIVGAYNIACMRL
jgi:hypothetical protein